MVCSQVHLKPASLATKSSYNCGDFLVKLIGITLSMLTANFLLMETQISIKGICLNLVYHLSRYSNFMQIFQFQILQYLSLAFPCRFLAHLSRRLMGELIVYQSLRRPSVRRPSVRLSVRQHFQTSSPLKPLGQLNSNFIWRLLRTREQKFVQMVLVT